MIRYNTLITINHNVVAGYLRHFFKTEWDKQYPHNPWQDDDASLNYFIQQERNQGKAKKSLKGTGDRNAWDLTVLFYVLLYSDAMGQKLQQHQLLAHTAIDQLRLSRNSLSHVSPSTYVNQGDYKRMYGTIKNCLRDLGYHDAYTAMEDVAQQQNPNRRETFITFCKNVGLAVFIWIAFLLITWRYPWILSGSSGRSPAPDFNQTPVNISTVNGNISDKVNTTGESYHIMCAFHFPGGLIPDYFIGRDLEMSQVIEAVHKGIHIISIVGPSGYGKTSLSLSLGRYFKEREDYSVAYSSLLNSDGILAAYETILASFGYKAQYRYPEVSQLRFPTDKQMLLILDDVDVLLGQFKEEFQDMIVKLVHFHQVTILILSNYEWESDIKTVQVRPLDTHLSLDLLASVNTSSEAALHISNITRGIPLLLEFVYLQLVGDLYSAIELIQACRQSNVSIDPGNSTSYFPLLKILIQRVDVKLQVDFVRLGMNLQRDCLQTDSCSDLADLGLIKLTDTCTKCADPNKTEFRIHRVLEEFAIQLGPSYIKQYRGCPSMRSTSAIILLSVIVIVLANSLTLNGQDKSGRPIITWACLCVMGCCSLCIYIQQDYYNKVNGTIDKFAIIFTSICLTLILIHMVTYMCTRLNPNVPNTLVTNWIFHFSSLPFISYVSVFLWIHGSHMMKGELYTTTLDPMKIHLSICVMIITCFLFTDTMITNVTGAQFSGLFSKWLYRQLIFISDWFLCFLCWIMIFSVFMYKSNESTAQLDISLLESKPLHHIVFVAIGIVVTYEHNRLPFADIPTWMRRNSNVFMLRVYLASFLGMYISSVVLHRGSRQAYQCVLRLRPVYLVMAYMIQESAILYFAKSKRIHIYRYMNMTFAFSILLYIILSIDPSAKLLADSRRFDTIRDLDYLTQHFADKPFTCIAAGLSIGLILVLLFFL